MKKIFMLLVVFLNVLCSNGQSPDIEWNNPYSSKGEILKIVKIENDFFYSVNKRKSKIFLEKRKWPSSELILEKEIVFLDDRSKEVKIPYKFDQVFYLNGKLVALLGIYNKKNKIVNIDLYSIDKGDFTFKKKMNIGSFNYDDKKHDLKCYGSLDQRSDKDYLFVNCLMGDWDGYKSIKRYLIDESGHLSNEKVYYYQSYIKDFASDGIGKDFKKFAFKGKEYGNGIFAFGKGGDNESKLIKYSFCHSRDKVKKVPSAYNADFPLSISYHICDLNSIGDIYDMDDIKESKSYVMESVDLSVSRIARLSILTHDKGAFFIIEPRVSGEVVDGGNFFYYEDNWKLINLSSEGKILWEKKFEREDGSLHGSLKQSYYHFFKDDYLYLFLDKYYYKISMNSGKEEKYVYDKPLNFTKNVLMKADENAIYFFTTSNYFKEKNVGVIKF